MQINSLRYHVSKAGNLQYNQYISGSGVPGITFGFWDDAGWWCTMFLTYYSGQLVAGWEPELGYNPTEYFTDHPLVWGRYYKFVWNFFTSGGQKQVHLNIVDTTTGLIVKGITKNVNGQRVGPFGPQQIKMESYDFNKANYRVGYFGSLYYSGSDSGSTRFSYLAPSWISWSKTVGSTTLYEWRIT